MFTYIHLSLASYLSQIFKFCLFLHDVSIFWLEHLYILPKLQRSALKDHVLCRKTFIYSWNSSEKLSLMYEDSFPFPFLCNLKYIRVSILSIIAWKATESSWSPYSLFLDTPCFLKLCFQAIFPFLMTMDISTALDYWKSKIFQAQ